MCGLWIFSSHVLCSVVIRIRPRQRTALGPPTRESEATVALRGRLHDGVLVAGLVRTQLLKMSAGPLGEARRVPMSSHHTILAIWAMEILRIEAVRHTRTVGSVQKFFPPHFSTSGSAARRKRATGRAVFTGMRRQIN